MNKTLKAVCYGEVLIDVFPDEERIGGAPLNVATRLSNFGVSTTMISKVGMDEKGEQILNFLKINKVEVSNILRDSNFPTGIVNVNLSNSGSATYDIAYPSAWDKIEVTDNIRRTVEEADMFIFGSLIGRDEVSRSSLFKLLNSARYKVLDFNLRPPHYTADLLSQLIHHADFIKFNDDELFEIAELFGSPYNSLEQNLQYLAEKSSAKTICVTKGRHGAVLLHEKKLFYNSGYKVEVKDTVGAGDSFLASLLVKLFLDIDPQKALDHACAVGALVAAEKGANPTFQDKEIENFISPPPIPKERT